MSIQTRVNSDFINAFGRTPLGERLEDILREAIELSRFTDINNLQEEAGDLLASTIQLCSECGWDYESVIQHSLNKIKSRENQYKTLGRKLKIGLIGGAFDPPTIGHIKLAQFVLNTSKEFDEVWLVPCANHMNNKYMAPPLDRIAMCYRASTIDPRISVFDYEIINNLRGETYNFMKRLLEDENYKDKYNFSVIIGIDNANTFDKWINYELLERLVRFVVVSRKGYDRDSKVDWYIKSPHIYLHSESEIPETSSTEVRTLFKNDYNTIIKNVLSQTSSSERLRELIDPNVLQYIERNKLYLE